MGLDDRILRKVYFIKRPAEGEEVQTLLKNKFKIVDAIRDVLTWLENGRDFRISLRRWFEEELDPAGESEELPTEEVTIEISQWFAVADNNRSAMTSFRAMIDWLTEDRAFDISLIPNRAPPQVHLN